MESSPSLKKKKEKENWVKLYHRLAHLFHEFSRTSTNRRGGLKIRTPGREFSFKLLSTSFPTHLSSWFVSRRSTCVYMCVSVCYVWVQVVQRREFSVRYPPSDPVRVLKQTRRLATTLLYRAYLSTSFVLVRRPLSLATTRRVSHLLRVFSPRGSRCVFSLSWERALFQ